MGRRENGNIISSTYSKKEQYDETVSSPLLRGSSSFARHHTDPTRCRSPFVFSSWKLPGGALKQGHKTEKNQDNENPDPIEKMLQVRQDVKRPRGPAAPASIERHKARRDPGFKDHLNKGEDVFVPSSIHVIRIRIYNPITPIPDGPNNTIKNTLKNLINTNIAT
ncbi:hypothetical protein Tco_1071650 [Tanacetum coccineum]